MATSALTQLQDQIEAIRREAFAAGYAAAMQAIQKAASQSAPGAAPPAARPRRPAAAAEPAPRQRRRRAAKGADKAPARPAGRPRRGTNAQLVAEVLQTMAPRAVRPAEIRSALQRDKGVSMAFTSIRHALGQLEARRAVEQIADSKTWRHLG